MCEKRRPCFRRIWLSRLLILFFYQAEDGIRDIGVTGVQTCGSSDLACAHAPIPQSGTHLRAEEPAPSGTVPAPIQISTILPKPTPTSRPETYSVVVNGVKVQELLLDRKSVV